MRRLAAAIAITALLVAGVVTAQAAQPSGDVNGDGLVTTVDAQLTLASIAGLTPLVHPANDVNCDGLVTTADAQIILAHVAGLPTPAGCLPPNCIQVHDDLVLCTTD